MARRKAQFAVTVGGRPVSSAFNTSLIEIRVTDSAGQTADTAAIERLAKITQDRGADGTVGGTPTLIVNGTKVDGITWPDVEKALKAAGA